MNSSKPDKRAGEQVCFQNLTYTRGQVLQQSILAENSIPAFLRAFSILWSSLVENELA